MLFLFVEINEKKEIFIKNKINNNWYILCYEKFGVLEIIKN